MLLIICHNNGIANPPEEAMELFPASTRFRHFQSHNKYDGYRYWAQVDVAGTENLAVTRKNEMEWVDFDNYRIGG